jgi:hypothetical protein
VPEEAPSPRLGADAQRAGNSLHAFGAKAHRAGILSEGLCDDFRAELHAIAADDRPRSWIGKLRDGLRTQLATHPDMTATTPSTDAQRRQRPCQAANRRRRRYRLHANAAAVPVTQRATAAVPVGRGIRTWPTGSASTQLDKPDRHLDRASSMLSRGLINYRFPEDGGEQYPHGRVRQAIMRTRRRRTADWPAAT